MVRIPALAALVLIAACSGPAPRTDPVASSSRPAGFDSDSSWQAMESRLRTRIAKESGEVAVAVIDLGTGRRLGIADTVTMHAASTMKVPVLYELFRQAERSPAALERPVLVRNEFRSIADGSTYSLTASDDSDPDLYAMVGQRLTALELARRMTVRSSNLATNILIDEIRADSVAATMAALGASGMRVLRGVEDIPAYRRGMNNTATARGFANLLEAIARCRGLTAASCRAIVDILAAQEFNEMIPAGLPAGTRVAHKTGWITAIQHDGGIVYPEGRAPYVLVVMTRGVADTLAAAQVAADVSKEVWTTLMAEQEANAPTSASAREAAALHARFYVPSIFGRRFTHAQLWGALDPIVAGSPALEVEEVGRSVEGRPIRLVRFGTGPTRVLMWSQMHGDETTASRSLVDLANYLASSADDPTVRRLSERVTLLMIPMLNPDGAERHQRRNVQGIDVNRDARFLSTPEARALKAVHDRWKPDFGFNLHDQNPRTRVGTSDRLAAIALLAPAFDEARSDNTVRTRAKRVAGVIRQAVEPFVPGHVTRYDDTFNPRAFGDLVQQWGTSTVLIESGGWRGDAEKEHLRRANFVGLLAALEAIAGTELDEVDLDLYEGLPQNGRAVNDLLIAGGAVVLEGVPPYRADVAIDYEVGRTNARAEITDVGDLSFVEARDTIDASGLYLHVRPRDGSVDQAFGPGAEPHIVIRRGAAPTSAAVWRIEAGRPRPAADPY